MELNAGYKQTEVGVIPKDWDVIRLGDYAKLKNGFAFKSENFSDKGPIVITPGNFKLDGGLKFDINKIVRYSGQIEDYMKFSNGDLIMVMTDLTPDCNLLGKSGIVNTTEILLHNQRIGKLILKENLDSLFLSYFLNSSMFSNRMKNTATGSTVRHTSSPTIKNTNLALPPLKEQTAIATALSDVDSWITSLEQLIAKKRLLKQGAMQELLKAKEGWEVKKLGDVCEVKKGQLITSDTKINGNIPVIAGGKTPAYYHNTANRSGKTITISASGASAGYIGFHDYPIFASDCSTISESTHYVIEFIYYFLSRNQEVIYSYQTGGAQPHIHAKDIQPMDIGIPTLQEQALIANILSDMDSELSALENKLEKAKKIKMGMMQELLTGRIRLV